MPALLSYGCVVLGALEGSGAFRGAVRRVVGFGKGYQPALVFVPKLQVERGQRLRKFDATEAYSEAGRSGNCANDRTECARQSGGCRAGYACAAWVARVSCRPYWGASRFASACEGGCGCRATRWVGPRPPRTGMQTMRCRRTCNPRYPSRPGSFGSLENSATLLP